MPDENIQQAANEHYVSRFDDEQRALIEVAEDYNNERWEEAREELEQQPLCIERIATYHRDEEVEWEILLGTGGPADRVLVRTDLSGNVEGAIYQYQDWFQPWTAAESQDEKLVESYARIVGYYESEPDA